ncbi:hypothetical protein A4F89_01480 [Polynucleobacter asymbioticus]|uniref:Uncharacterized protein n=2 Tax=Polynucleobacter asymbioticus TaxID=576611 RepID=A0AAC9NGY0_9BURK|nr:hypothetical protein A4F89_01480 [Polynucleobacter asymbioticus]APC00386.1 hypothetical protein AOC25_01485 [Polynucleobacter asymbioticus]
MGSELKDLVLYCKSYRNDFLRLKRLLSSIEQFNSEKLPFYISTPRADKSELVQAIGNAGYLWVADEDIVVANPRAPFEKYQAMPGGLSQAIVKSEFWRLGLAENYLCLDSDCVFIRSFSRADFMMEDGVPFTVLHQNKEYFQLAVNRGEQKTIQNLRAEAQRVQSLFGRIGPEFYCAPAPFIWSAKVWESLDREYLQPKGITLWDMVTPEYPETLIYGEALLSYRAIPLIAIEPLFRVYHYDWQYFLMRRLGEAEEKLKSNYLGVLYQSNWDFTLSSGEKRKSLPSRVLKKVKRTLRYLQSYI